MRIANYLVANKNDSTCMVHFQRKSYYIQIRILLFKMQLKLTGENDLNFGIEI